MRVVPKVHEVAQLDITSDLKVWALGFCYALNRGSNHKSLDSGLRFGLWGIFLRLGVRDTKPLVICNLEGAHLELPNGGRTKRGVNKS